MSIASPHNRVATPALVEGEHLDQAEFHRRYEAMPAHVRAELIDGVVSMPSPVAGDHGLSHGAVMAWLIFYAAETPGIEVYDNTTIVLGTRSEPQPDALLRIRPEYGGRTATDGGYLHGAPELVVEVAQSSRYLDLGPKMADYSRAGVREYVVRAFHPDEVAWFRQVDGTLTKVAPDADGLYRSMTFPGLWLDPSALLAADLKGLRRAVDQGLAAPDHAAFVARLAGNRAGAP